MPEIQIAFCFLHLHNSNIVAHAHTLRTRACSCLPRRAAERQAKRSRLAESAQGAAGAHGAAAHDLASVSGGLLDAVDAHVVAVPSLPHVANPALLLDMAEAAGASAMPDAALRSVGMPPDLGLLSRLADPSDFGLRATTHKVCH